jgi:hypothetical protein
MSFQMQHLQVSFFSSLLTFTLLFSYITSNESDPFNEDGVMWSLNFLFFNKTLRRILLFSVRAIHQNSSEEESEDVEYVMDYQD